MIIQISRNEERLSAFSYFYLKFHANELKFYIWNKKILWIEFKK